MSGRFVSYGVACKRGLEMAAAAVGEKIAGRSYEYIYRDVQSDARTTVSAFTELSDTDHLNYIIGPIASPIVAAAIPPWQVNKPVWIVPGSSSTSLEEMAGQEQNMFHPYPYAYNYQKSLAVALKHYLGAGKSLAVIYTDDSYGHAHLPAVEKFYKDAGFNIVAEETLRTNSPDMTPLLTRVGSLKPDVLLGVVQTSDAITLAKQERTLRLNIPYLVTTGAAKYAEWQNAVDEAQEGWMSPSTFLPGVEDWPADATYPKVFPGTKAWETEFNKRYGREPEDNDLLCYNSAAMLLIAIDKAGGDDKERVAAELSKLKVMTPMGLGQYVQNEGTRNQAFSDMVIFQRQNRKSVIVYPLDIATGTMKTAQ